MASLARDEAKEDVTFCSEVESLRRWIRSANEVLGIAEGDESGKVPADVEVLFNRFNEGIKDLNNTLGPRLEIILTELKRLRDLVG